eukprot:12909773-Ditylum_brightwellii.AAC.1
MASAQPCISGDADTDTDAKPARVHASALRPPKQTARWSLPTRRTHSSIAEGLASATTALAAAASQFSFVQGTATV